MIIQGILLVAIFGLMVYLLQNKNTARLRAWKKLLLFLFMLFAAVSILWPQTMTDVAHLVGVGRGTDLLLYGTVVCFVFFVLATYLKFKEMEQQYVKLARQIALVDAKQQSPKKPKAKQS
jgi:small membrane protein